LDELEKDYEIEQIKKALNLLKPDEREIIFLRFSE
jgi:DNA-directed RNA polymerase sigma subunit (sigma70/sigma32)